MIFYRKFLFAHVEHGESGKGQTSTRDTARHRKKSLESDNQNLAEKLENCLRQLKETAGLLQKEQEVSAQLESSRAQLNADKSVLQRLLAEQKGAILSLQANFEKQHNLCKATQEKLSESEALAVTTLNSFPGRN